MNKPNSGDEANLAKWGWPSPELLKRHKVPEKREPIKVEFDEDGEPSF